MGTPEFSVPSLERLIKEYDVVGVFTQPDRPKGRGQKVQFTPVKEIALKHNIPVFQPERLRKDNQSIESLRKLNPDVIVVIAYGQILPKEVLEIPVHGCINVHASLLPRLRGAAPINWAIINGYTRTGITTMLMDEGLDTGDMLLKEEIDILEGETAGELHDRLMILGADVLIKTLKALESGQLKPEKQDDSMSTYAPMLKKELGRINWDKNAKDIYNLIRGVTPWPGAYCYYKGTMIKIWKADKIDEGDRSNPGEILKVSREGIEVACRKGSIIIKELQEVGGKRMNVAAYLNGHNLKSGEKLE